MESTPQTPGKKIEKKIKLDFGGATQQNERPGKKENEDEHFITLNSAGVFDGMGGHLDGKIASRMARHFIEKELSKIPKSFSLVQAEQALKDILTSANTLILEEARKMNNGMGTTVAVLLFWPDENGKQKAIVGHAGDSRVYTLLKHGGLEQITLDDSAVMRQVFYGQESKMRNTQNRFNNITEMSQIPKEDLLSWTHRHAVDNYLGLEDFKAHTTIIDALEGDIFLICSDGVSENLVDDQITKELRGVGNAQAKAMSIVETAYNESKQGKLRSTPDDITVVVVEVSSK